MLIGILKLIQGSIKVTKISICGEVDNHVFLKMFKYKVQILNKFNCQAKQDWSLDLAWKFISLASAL